MSEKVLRLPMVLEKIGVCRSTIYAWVSKGAFPSPIQLGERSVGWKETDVDFWLKQRSYSSEVSEGE